MATPKENLICELCNREVDAVTRHHLLPKQEGGRYSDTVDLCQPCHSTIHRTFSNRELARGFTSVQALQQAEPLQKYLDWIKNKNNITRISNRRGKRR
ncbi:HNH endonuclease [Adhaeribacter radiodurans]|uniref:HNH endonuclease n=1 Tax=Adhaeribacter radiodurans TaxID=2745197 RepID=A0A7L7L9H5_9BACT|nr:HNH endonuclease [Adhaeribacter radiodurans]QMU29480.1 HNH endonuclease [Adhaeribacter radiodurans]